MPRVDVVEAQPVVDVEGPEDRVIQDGPTAETLADGAGGGVERGGRRRPSTAARPARSRRRARRAGRRNPGREVADGHDHEPPQPGPQAGRRHPRLARARHRSNPFVVPCRCDRGARRSPRWTSDRRGARWRPRRRGRPWRREAVRGSGSLGMHGGSDRGDEVIRAPRRTRAPARRRDAVPRLVDAQRHHAAGPSRRQPNTLLREAPGHR